MCIPGICQLHILHTSRLFRKWFLTWSRGDTPDKHLEVHSFPKELRFWLRAMMNLDLALLQLRWLLPSLFSLLGKSSFLYLSLIWLVLPCFHYQIMAQSSSFIFFLPCPYALWEFPPSFTLATLVVLLSLLPHVSSLTKPLTVTCFFFIGERKNLLVQNMFKNFFKENIF